MNAEDTDPERPHPPPAAGEDEEAPDAGPGIFPDLGTLPPGTPVTEDGLARLLGKTCRESVKRAVERGELPRPVRLMGKNTWTVGIIVKHLEARLEAEARKIARLRA